MKKIILLLCFFLLRQGLFAVEATSVTDSVDYLMQRQLLAFPQEKIYVQTDKAGYLSGERIWFRAHIVDALTHQQVFISRYIYVELIGPLNDLVKRVKIRPDSTGIYSGYIDLGEDLAQGAYTLRAYTQFMRNRSEDYFFRRVIQVLDPFSLQLEPLVSFDIEKNDLHISLQFIDRQLNDTIIPEVVTYKIGYSSIKTLKPKNNSEYNLNVRLSQKDTNRTLLLSLIYKGRKYNRYYTIPVDQTEYDIQFFPEGGYIISDVTTKVAFKALNADGKGINVTGTLYDSADRQIVTFESMHKGMGLFHFIPSENETYYAICRNESGTSKRFELPPPQPSAQVVTAHNVGNWLRINHSMGKQAERDTVSLLIHNKGLVLLHETWNPKKEIYSIENKDLPTGILNILLLNSKREVLSERLIFNLNDDEFAHLSTYTPAESYKRREHISVALRLTDHDSTPITGNIAVSVTDKKSVLTDSTINITSTLLLSSELKGYIESPNSYFQEGELIKYALDALMLTQGWRRYDIPAVIKGKIETPDTFAPERVQKVTGKADGVFRSLQEGQISLLARLDTMVNTQITQADENGRFTFEMEYPENTSMLVQSLSKKGGTFNFINLDKETFPALDNSSLPLKSEFVNINNTYQDSYIQLANEDYTQQNGIRTILLDEFTVTAKSVEKYKESRYYSPISAIGVKTSDDIEQMRVHSLRSLLQRQSGIIFRGDVVTTTRSEAPVLFIIDNMQFEDFSDRIDDIEVSSIESIFVLRDNTSLPGFFPNNSGAIVITTKTGGYKGANRRSSNIDEIVPLGYQQAAQFYAPSYKTPEQIGAEKADLRTTLFWKPNMQFSAEGEALVDFYSADSPGTYQIVAEGVSDNGKLIRMIKEITVESSN